MRYCGNFFHVQKKFARGPLLTIYKSFIRPHLDYADAIYDQHYNNSFPQKLESVQYNAALGITSAIKGSSREKTLSKIRFEIPKTMVTSTTFLGSLSNISF